MFGKKFKVLKSFGTIYKRIGDYEFAYIYGYKGNIKYEIIDDLFGQPSPANWDDSCYAKQMRNKMEEELQHLLDLGFIELLEE